MLEKPEPRTANLDKALMRMLDLLCFGGTSLIHAKAHRWNPWTSSVNGDDLKAWAASGCVSKEVFVMLPAGLEAIRRLRSGDTFLQALRAAARDNSI